MARLDLSKRVKKLVDKVLSKGFLNDLGKDTADQVRKRTRLGRGVEASDSPSVKLDPLSIDYVKKRRKSKLNTDTRPKKSNLTFSGKMLDDITYIVKDKEITILIGSASSRDKASWVTDKGRPFMNLSKPEINNIKRRIRDRIRVLINK